MKAYAMTIKKEKTLNKWLDEQLKAELIMLRTRTVDLVSFLFLSYVLFSIFLFLEL